MMKIFRNKPYNYKIFFALWGSVLTLLGVTLYLNSIIPIPLPIKIVIFIFLFILYNLSGLYCLLSKDKINRLKEDNNNEDI
jgi:hypothetical protein